MKAKCIQEGTKVNFPDIQKKNFTQTTGEVNGLLGRIPIV